MNYRFLTALYAILACGFAQTGFAHEPKQSYVFLGVHGDELDGRVEITIDDINAIFSTSLPTDGSVALSDMEPYINDIRAYLEERVALQPEGVEVASLPLTHFGLMEVSSGQYLQYFFEFPVLPAEPDYVDVDYNVMFDRDPVHRAFLVIETNWQTGTFENESNISLSFEPGRTSERLDLSTSSVWRGFAALIDQGIHHIWIGLDHILFLMALLLPSVVRREPNGWVSTPHFRSALIYVVKVVTVFTIAHTITLSLASLGTISLPPRFVESVIALSIAVAAADIVFPIFGKRIWLIVFAFGLFHGFGFASVLGDIGIPPKYMALSLAGFNIGVELGQLAIVCVAFPLLFLLRRWWVYPRVILRFGSFALIAIAMYWFVERSLDVDLPAGAMLSAVLDQIGSVLS